MKRKVLSGLLISLMTLSLLAGCGKNNASQPEVGRESYSEEGASSETVTDSEGSKDNQEAEENKGTENNKETEKEENMEAADKTEVPILKDSVMENMGCLMGCAATESELNDPKVWEIITTHFNALTFGNELKPDAMFGYSNGRCPGTEEAELNGETIVVPKMDFSRAERMLNKVYDWNEQNPDKKIMVRGHVLVWHSQTPEWFFHVDYDKNKDYVDKDTMNKRLEWYIRTMLTHFTGEDSKYKGMFYGWDVVNEAVSDGTGTYRSDNENPNEPLSNNTHGSNSSWWHVYQSNEYIINAFRYANKYAPADLELYYNDYNECGGLKAWGIEKLLQDVKAAEGEPGVGTRISGMGMQGHYNMADPDYSSLESAIKRYHDVVGNVQITEFDMKARDKYDGSDEMKEEEYKKQAGRYGAIYRLLKYLKKDEDVNITGITFWGTVDHYSWLQSRSDVGGGSKGNLPQCPLLFDENYEPKPAFYVFTQ